MTDRQLDHPDIAGEEHENDILAESVFHEEDCRVLVEA